MENVGEVAGYVWRFLEDEGKSSLSAINDAVDVPRSRVNMAVGWLAREDKIEFVKDGRATYIQLK